MLLARENSVAPTGQQPTGLSVHSAQWSQGEFSRCSARLVSGLCTLLWPLVPLVFFSTLRNPDSWKGSTTIVVDRFQRNEGEELAAPRFQFGNSSRPLKGTAEHTRGKVQQAVRNWWKSLHSVEEITVIMAASEDSAAIPCLGAGGMRAEARRDFGDLGRTAEVRGPRRSGFSLQKEEPGSAPCWEMPPPHGEEDICREDTACLKEQLFPHWFLRWLTQLFRCASKSAMF